MSGRDAEAAGDEAERRGLTPKPPVSIARWTLWWFLLGIGIFLFYILLTPIWIGLRALAWVAEFRARRRR